MTIQRPERTRWPVRASSAVLIEIIENGVRKILFLKQAEEWKQGMWGPPAGGFEKGEGPLECACREVQEELGISRDDFAIINFLGVYTDAQEEKTRIGFVFWATLFTSEFNLNPKEILETRYFTWREAMNLYKLGRLYQPEFNIPMLRTWRQGIKLPLDVVF